MELDTRPFSETILDLQRQVSFPLRAPTRRCLLCQCWLRTGNRQKKCSPCRTQERQQRWQAIERIGYRHGVHPELIEEFWAGVQDVGRVPCWPWPGPFTAHGFSVFAYGTGRFRVDRVSYQLLRTAIADCQYVQNACGLRGCVNPYHHELSRQAPTLNGFFFNGKRPTNGTPTS